MYIYIYIYILPIAHCILINIDNILTIIGHRFVHQSGLDQSSGRISAFVRLRIAFRVYLMFSQIDKNTKYCQILTKTGIFKKGMFFSKSKKRLRLRERRNKLLGLPIHIQIQIILIIIRYCVKMYQIESSIYQLYMYMYTYINVYIYIYIYTLPAYMLVKK